jgi:hypothetical protein
MQHFGDAISIWFEAVDEWCHNHEGLGGWVGAIGTVIAIFVTWGLARLEYRRTLKEQARRKASEIDTIHLVIEAFKGMLDYYYEIAVANDPGAIGFYSNKEGNGAIEAMQDLAQMSVISWPTISLYVDFRWYFGLAVQVLETSNSNPIDKGDLERKFSAQAGFLPRVIEQLVSARKRFLR